MSWQGNKINLPPNKVQKPSSVSEVKSDERRDLNSRRDTDTVKNLNITLLDIDSTIFNHLDKDINPHILTEGNTRTKVPIIYGSPDRWKSAQVDGVIRDYNGKIQLPIIMVKRNSFAKNESLMTLNRHLAYPVMTKYTEKNKYDKFSVLSKNVNPVNAVHMITLPDHIKITYNLMVWTELVEQMNMVLEKINFATEDYWGDKKRFRFRVYAGDYSNNVEITGGKDRIVRTEFSLTVMAYLLPDSFEDKKLTHQKLFTPKKVVLSETLTESLTPESSTQNIVDKEIKASLVGGYIQLDEEIEDLKQKGSPFSFEGVTNIEQPAIIGIQNTYINIISASAASKECCDIWHNPPTSENDYGQEGWMAYDGNFHYIYVNGKWKRQPISNFSNF